MSVLPLNVGRVSNLMQMNIANSQISSVEAQLANVQNQLTTGKVVNSPSDDPSAAAMIQEIDKTLEKRDAYSTNITAASNNLAEVDTTLSSVTTLLNQAQTLASANVGDDVSDADRQAAATQVKSIYDQLLTAANTSFNGSYIFGGDKQDQQPFVETAGGVEFVGSSTTLSNAVDDNSMASLQVDGANVWGALSSQVQSSSDISPSVTTATRITDLRGATDEGVTLGTITISNGSSKAKVDLSNANDLGDVIDDINNAGLAGVTASLTASGIQISGGAGDTLSVTDATGATTAGDLGILQTTPAAAGTPITGMAVKSNITALTNLSDLNGGAGIDTTGFTISNGSQTKTIDLSGMTTVGDLMNAVNGSGLGVTMQVKSDGTGLKLLNATQGPAMTISENGGTTASDLGLRSFSPTTALSNLNGGDGVKTVSGADFSIQDSAGVSFDVDLSDSQTTVQDVIDQINTSATAAGAGVTASFSTTGNGIVLTDTAGGGGTLTLTSQNDSEAAKDLGLTGAAVGNAITGTDVNPVEATGVFSNLQKLIDSLTNDDKLGINSASTALQADYQRVVNVHGQVGAQTQALQNRSSALSAENLSTKALLSQLQDTDFASAATQYSTLQNALQASMLTTSHILNMSLLNFLS